MNDEEFYAAQNAGFGIDQTPVGITPDYIEPNTMAPTGATTLTSGSDDYIEPNTMAPTNTTSQMSDDYIEPNTMEPSTAPNDTNYELEEVTVTADLNPFPQDTRVRIEVPPSYLEDNKYTEGGTNKILKEIGGIIFPYTPQISYDYKAEYRDQPVTHSNFRMNFYQRSYVSDIIIQGKFSVQNDTDAQLYLATHHLLRALTKMQTALDEHPGSPPPVCRLMAYGTFILRNTPIVITDFKVDLPADVDYYRVTEDQLDNKIYAEYNAQAIPTLSTISVTCTPMYSRAEMLTFSVKEFLQDSGRKSGYL